MWQLHPLRLQYEIFSDANPLMAPVANFAEQVRRARKPAAADNPFVAFQERLSQLIVASLNGWRDAMESYAERTFLSVYGSPNLQSAAGVDPVATKSLRRAARSLLHRELLQARIGELESRIPLGGLRAAVVRGLLYVGMPRAAVDERGFEMTRRIRRAYNDIPLSVFKALVREQYLMLLIDPGAALAAIPAMLPAEADSRGEAFDLIKQVMAARGALSAEDIERILHIARLFGIERGPGQVQNLVRISPDRKQASGS
jgi:hypothetical protein